MKPLAIDLYCGLDGWAEGFLAEGYEVIGFDIERHDYGTGGYPGQLVLQDILTLHGAHFKDATVIVASPPCQKYSYMAMPWKKAKALAAWYHEDAARIVELNALFDACFRIQREASEAAGRYIPLIVENVKGAQPWVGRAQAHFGSFYLWGSVGQVGDRVVVLNGRDTGLRPCSRAQKMNPDGTSHPQGSWFAIADSKNRGAQKVPGFRFDGSGKSFQSESVKVTGQDWSRHAKTGEVSPHWRMEGLKTQDHLNIRNGECHTRHLTNPAEHIKNSGGSWFNVAHNTESGKCQNSDGRKGTDAQCAGDRRTWFDEGLAKHGSKSGKRKAASALIAKIPFPLANHIARSFKP